MTNRRSLLSDFMRIVYEPLPAIIKRALARLKLAEDHRIKPPHGYWRRSY